MASFFLITFLLPSISISSPASNPLLSLNCSQPSRHNDQPIKELLDNLTLQVTENQSITFDYGWFTGHMQCRHSLDQIKCTLCTQNAKDTISTVCLNSDAVTAWFDGCYIQYHQKYLNVTHEELDNSTSATWSCSTNRTSSLELVQFESSLQTLLLRLRAEVNLATHNGFSYGELNYGMNSKVYGIVECVRSLSPDECEVCIGEAINKVNEYCGGQDGGTVAHRLCLVRFDIHQFYSEFGGSSGGSVAISVWESGKGGSADLKQKLAWALGGCGTCLLGGVLFAWLLKRSVLNRTKVATMSAMDDGEIGNKGNW